MLAIINCIIFVAISGIHFYWGFGGKWGGNAAFPTIKSSKPIRPSKFITIVVAFVFLFFALLFFDKSGLKTVALPAIIKQYGILILAFIFIIRAIGDFKYVGFLKKEKESLFATLDSKYYSPLCLYLGFSSLIISYL